LPVVFHKLATSNQSGLLDMTTKEYNHKYFSKPQNKKKQKHRSWLYARSNPQIMIYGAYKSNAKIRGIEWNLPFEEFLEFWGQSCSYCGSPIKRIGLDRIDNRMGYIKNNLTPCCRRCNKMKSDMPAQEFINHCRKVLGHYNLWL
jgi:5-methylcytosine-specific restriction endonuclease McrA